MEESAALPAVREGGGRVVGTGKKRHGGEYEGKRALGRRRLDGNMILKRTVKCRFEEG